MPVIAEEHLTTDSTAPDAPAPHGPHAPAPPQAPPAAVALHSVSKRYGRGRYAVTALEEITAEFPRGSFSAVMGLSGSGKSTLLQLAAGLDQPSAGSVHLGGTDLGKLRRRQLSVVRRRRVGFVFQAFNLVPSLSVAENIALPLRLDHRPVDKHAIALLAERVGVAGQLNRLPATLSGGQQQRVAIARSLVTRPEVIFADEPTAALDPYTSDAVMDVLRTAVDELGQTVVVVTHEPAVAARADRALLLHRGRLAGVVEAPAAGLLAAALHRFGETEQVREVGR